MLSLLLDHCPSPGFSVITRLQEEIAPEQVIGVSMTWLLPNIYFDSIFHKVSCISISQWARALVSLGDCPD